MESILDLLFDPAKNQRPRRLFVYGPDKVGKSTFAAGAPSPVFVPTEDGLRNLTGIKQFPVAKTLHEWWGYVQMILNNETPFKTLVIDSTTGLERLVHQVICEQEGKKTLAEVPYGKGPGMAAGLWQKCLDHLETAHITREMNLVLLGHMQVEKYSAPDGDSYDRIVPKLEKAASAALREWVDEYFLATHRVLTRSEGEGKTAKKKAIGGNDRVLKTTGAAAWLAGRRLALPDEIPLAWAAYQAGIDCMAAAELDVGEEQEEGSEAELETQKAW